VKKNRFGAAELARYRTLTPRKPILAIAGSLARPPSSSVQLSAVSGPVLVFGESGRLSGFFLLGLGDEPFAASELTASSSLRLVSLRKLFSLPCGAPLR